MDYVIYMRCRFGRDGLHLTKMEEAFASYFSREDANVKVEQKGEDIKSSEGNILTSAGE